jgi:hypothetical protein
MMTLQSNSHRSIGTLVTSVARVYQIEVDPSDTRGLDLFSDITSLNDFGIFELKTS